MIIVTRLLDKLKDKKKGNRFNTDDNCARKKTITVQENKFYDG